MYWEKAASNMLRDSMATTITTLWIRNKSKREQRRGGRREEAALSLEGEEEFERERVWRGNTFLSNLGRRKSMAIPSSSIWWLKRYERGENVKDRTDDRRQTCECVNDATYTNRRQNGAYDSPRYGAGLRRQRRCSICGIQHLRVRRSKRRYQYNCRIIHSFARRIVRYERRERGEDSKQY